MQKDKCQFRSTSVSFFNEVISRHGVRPDSQKLKVLMEVPLQNKNKGIPSIPWNNYLSKFTPSIADICESL